MPRQARLIVSGLPHHIVQRGHNRSAVFIEDSDYQYYLDNLAEWKTELGLRVFSYCLMTNHVHLIVVPQREDSMALALGRAHMQHARRVNRDQGWCGHLWANRFYSSPLDWDHLWQAVRYVELNPVRAGMAARAEDYAWSSCREHGGLCEETGLLDSGGPFPGHVGAQGWCAWINSGVDPAFAERIRRDTMSGRPCGGRDFVKDLELRLGRILESPQMGRPRKAVTPEALMEDLFA